MRERMNQGGQPAAHPGLDPEVERALIRAWRCGGDRAARDRLVDAHMPLVHAYAAQFAREGVCARDLAQEGAIGLLIAADRADPDADNRFSTYATYWVRHQISCYVMANMSAVAIGRSRTNEALFFRTTELRRAVAAAGGGRAEDITDQQIAEHHGYRLADVERMRAALSGAGVSLDAPVGADDEGETRGSLLADPRLTPEAALAERHFDAERTRVIQEVLAELGERSATILVHRYLSATPKHLREIGAMLDLSAERVRQLEKEALGRVRAILTGRGLAASDLMPAAAV